MHIPPVYPIPTRKTPADSYKDYIGHTGGEIICEILRKQGVKHLFGYPGGAILPVFDALYHHQQNMDFFLPRHEQCGMHMATGYARASGKPGS